MVDGIFHVVRGFRDEKILASEVGFNPVRDMKIINNELLQKDL